MREYFNSERRPVKVYEDCSDPLLVEQVGFMTVKAQVERLMQAGIRLADYKKQLFDFQADEEVDESLEVRPRNVDYEFTDAGSDMVELALKKEERKRRLVKTSVEKALDDVVDGEQDKDTDVKGKEEHE